MRLLAWLGIRATSRPMVRERVTSFSWGASTCETFIVAQPPGGQPAPVVHNQPPFPDASMNPATEPIHTYHLGLWFGSPSAAQAAGCPNTVTRFNGDHNAGIQALSTRNFGKLKRTPKAVDALIEVDHKSGSLTSPSTSEATPNRCVTRRCVPLQSRLEFGLGLSRGFRRANDLDC